MNRLVAILLVAVPSLFGAAQAASDLTSYVGIQYGSSEDDDGNVDVDIDYGMIRLGLMLNDNTAIEYRLGRGISDDTVNGVTFDLESVYGAYILYHFSFSANASIYGAAGGTYVSYKASFGGLSDQDGERGVSLGFGAQLYGFNLEFMQYVDTSELKVGAIAVGYNYEFD